MVISFSESVHISLHLQKIIWKFKKKKQTTNKQTDKKLEILHLSK